MKTIIKCKNANVTYEVKSSRSGEPKLVENIEIVDNDFILKEIPNEANFNVGEAIYLSENESIEVEKVIKTLDGDTFILTNFVNKSYDEEEKKFFETYLTRQEDKFAKDLLKRYSGVSNMMKALGKDNPTSREIIAMVKGLNSVQDDFFTR